MLYASDLVRWLQRKRYQYEVTFSLYMLTPTEKFIFSMASFVSYEIPSYYFLRLLLYRPPPFPCHSAAIGASADVTSCRHIPPSLPLHDHRCCFAIPPRTRDENG